MGGQLAADLGQVGLVEDVVDAGRVVAAERVVRERVEADPLADLRPVTLHGRELWALEEPDSVDVPPVLLLANFDEVISHVRDADLRAEIQHAIDDANKAVSKAEAIKSFRILGVDFTEEGGQLTPSLKLKRAVVMKEFAADVDAIYSGSAPKD